MKTKIILTTLLLFLPLPRCAAQDTESTVIPLPAKAELNGIAIPLPEGHIVYNTRELAGEASYLMQELNRRTGTHKLKQSKRSRKGLFLKIDPTLAENTESYRLEVNDKRVTVAGGSRAGVFYGIQTLLQELDDDGMLNTGRIEDTPRYAWRGIMIDEARHFFGKQKMMQLIDAMAHFKLNKLHWHLTDEQAWRIEIKRYPLLTQEGGRGSWSEPRSRTLQYYTQADIREIVKYAAERHIEIIPEIDMPGHATAANRAYPVLSGGGTKDHPHFTFNPGRDTTYTFLANVLREVATLFPTPYLHIGGDEVAFGIEAWKTDPHVQALMKRHGMKQVREAEAYFMRRMCDSIRAMGKVPMGWDELLDLQPDPTKTRVMWWRHDKEHYLKKALEGGYATILCPRRPMYFDFIQHTSHKWGRVWNGFCPLEDVYAFPDPLLERVKPAENRLPLIKGLQANVWTERIHTPDRFDFMLYPRLCAVAEAGWTPATRKSWKGFELRMQQAYRYLDGLGIYYFDHRNPERHKEPKGAVQKNKEVPMDFRD